MKRQLLLLMMFPLFVQRSVAQLEYPYPVQYISLQIEKKEVRMAYMDIKPDGPINKTILLLHGKNFNGYYWKDVIASFIKSGYRVIVPDQVGWGRSDRSDLHYSFHLLAANTKTLLDSLQVKKTIILGHSMGGMLAIRFSLLFPGMVEKLVLEDPIGLEDYKTFVPYQPLEKLYQKEKSATYESYKKYQQGYYPQWKPEYEQYVKAQAADLDNPQFDQIAWTNALTYQMIYEQPVVYELNRLTVPVLLVTGEADRTIVGKDLLTDAQKKSHGQYPQLAEHAKQQIKKGDWIQLKGIGHIPHIQDLPAFEKAISPFIKN